MILSVEKIDQAQGLVVDRFEQPGQDGRLFGCLNNAEAAAYARWAPDVDPRTRFQRTEGFHVWSYPIDADYRIRIKLIEGMA